MERYALLTLLLAAAFAYTISDCTTINTPGYYELTNNITASVQNCITINSSDVTLDCKGYRIVNNASGTTKGVVVLGTNVSLINCTIDRFTYGVSIDEDNAFVNISYCSMDSTQYDVKSTFFSNITIDHSEAFLYCYPSSCEVHATDNVISVYDPASNSEFVNNTAKKNYYFVHLVNKNYQNLSLINNTANGILVLGGNTISNSYVYGNKVIGRGYTTLDGLFSNMPSIVNTIIENNIVNKSKYAFSYINKLENSTLINNEFNTVFLVDGKVNCSNVQMINNTFWGDELLFINSSGTYTGNYGFIFFCNVSKVSLENATVQSGIQDYSSSNIKFIDSYIHGKFASSSYPVEISGFTFLRSNLSTFYLKPIDSNFVNVTTDQTYLENPQNVTFVNSTVNVGVGHNFLYGSNGFRFIDSKQTGNGHFFYSARNYYNALIENSSVTDLWGSSMRNITVKNTHLTTIYLNNAVDVLIDGCAFSGTSYVSCVLFGGSNSNITIKNSRLNCGYSPVRIYSTATTISNLTQANNTVYGYNFYFFNPGSPVADINNTNTFFNCYKTNVSLSNISFDVPTGLFSLNCMINVSDSSMANDFAYTQSSTIKIENSEYNFTGSRGWLYGNRVLIDSYLRPKGEAIKYDTLKAYGSVIEYTGSYYLLNSLIVDVENSSIKAPYAVVFYNSQGNITNTNVTARGTCILISAKKNMDIDSSLFNCDGNFISLSGSTTSEISVTNTIVFSSNRFIVTYGPTIVGEFTNNAFVCNGVGCGVSAKLIDSLFENNIFVCAQGGTASFDVQDGTNVTIYNNVFQDCSITWNPNIAWNTTYDCNTTNIIGSGCLGGNYYSQYNGTDADNDGIGDTPYGYDALPLKAHHIDFNGTPWYPAFNTTNPITFAYHTKYGNGTVGTNALKRNYPDPYTLKYSVTVPIGSTNFWSVVLKAQDIINQTNFTITVQDFDLNATQNVSNEYPAYGWIMPKEPISGKPISFEANISGNVTFMLTNGTHWLCYREGWQACNESMDAKAISEHIDEWPYEELNWKAIIGAGGVLHWVKIKAYPSE